MFNQAMPDANTSFQSNEDALVKLVSDKSIDVAVIVLGQPAKLLVDMKPEARALIKLLKFDPTHPASQAALKTYFPTTIRAANYPNILTEDIAGLAVKAYLVTYDYSMTYTKDALAKFARSLCTNFDRLQQDGHPKWKEVQLAMPDHPGGTYRFAGVWRRDTPPGPAASWLLEQFVELGRHDAEIAGMIDL